MRDKIQSEALQVALDNQYCTLVLDMGSGKSKVACDVINSGYTRVLITTPTLNLKDSWLKELSKWIHKDSQAIIHINTINAVYNKDVFFYNLIIIDEVHKIGSKFHTLIKAAIQNNIKVLGLTGTPNEDDIFKSTVLYRDLPILYRYNNSEVDGVVNKTNYFLYKYNLTNEYKVPITTNGITFQKGELDAYNYIQQVIDSSKKVIEDYYLSDCQRRFTNLKDLKPSYVRFFTKILSKDLAYYKDKFWRCVKAKRMPRDLYLAMNEVYSTDYARFGVNARFYASLAPVGIRTYFYKYSWAINARRELLNTLQSSLSIAMKFKLKYLQNPNNKVLLFSELTSQANKLSVNVIHSNVSTKAKEVKISNERTLDRFNKGEIREVASCKSLQLGLNMVGANTAIFESFCSSSTSIKQSAGRLKRLEQDKVANIIVILPVNTQVEVWFNEGFKDIEFKEITL